MKKETLGSVVLKTALIIAGDLLALAVCYALYLAVYMIIESVFFANNPTSVPTDTIRNTYTAAIVILYFGLLRTRMSDLLKAIILAAPIAMSVVAVILAFYRRTVIAVLCTAVITAGCLFLLHRYKKTWYFYVSAAIAVAVAIAYAWPREIMY